MITVDRSLGAVNFLLDKADAEALMAALESAMQADRKATIPIWYKDTIMPLDFYIGGEDDFLYIGKNRIKIKISIDTIAYLCYKLIEFTKEGDFYPAELREFHLANSFMRKKNGEKIIWTYLLRAGCV